VSGLVICDAGGEPLAGRYVAKGDAITDRAGLFGSASGA